MPRVVISGQAARRFTGGQTEFEVEANNFRRMVLELDRRFPGLGHQIDEGMAVAIVGLPSGPIPIEIPATNGLEKTFRPLSNPCLTASSISLSISSKERSSSSRRSRSVFLLSSLNLDLTRG